MIITIILVALAFVVGVAVGAGLAILFLVQAYG